MKKIITTLGALTALAAPVVTVVACGNNGNTNTTNSNQEKVLPAQANIGDYEYPTLGEMFIDPMGLAKLFDAKLVDENAKVDKVTKDKLKQTIINDEVAVLNAVNIAKYDTKVKWDAYVDQELTMGELYNLLEKNKLGYIEIDESAKTITNHLQISPHSSKIEMKESIKEIWKNNPDLMNMYLNYVDANKTAKDVYYALSFMRATSNINNLLAAMISVDPGVYNTIPEKLSFLKEVVLGGSVNIDEMANGLKIKFSGKAPGFLESIVLVAGKIENNIFTKGPDVLWDIAIKTMGGEEVIEYLLNKVDVSFA